MPLYTYKCLDCNFENDELIRSSVDIPDRCPACNSEKYERVITAPGGYQMDSGPSSVRPRGAGSFKKRK